MGERISRKLRATGIAVPVLVGSLLFPWNASAAVGSPPSLTPLGDLPGGNFFSRAMGLSADGSTIVGFSSSSNSPGSNFEAFRWTSGSGMIGLGDLPNGGFDSGAFGVSADGLIVVGYG